MIPHDVISGPRFEVPISDPGYPDELRIVRNPPPRLYVIGDVNALKPGLGVIGARKATPYGSSCARRFALIAAAKGVTIISGGARGCDSVAHRAAIESGGRTVVFLGGGCDKVYPPEHRALFQDVVDAGGAVVSEHPWKNDPKPYQFRERNRLIAGLSAAVLIVEAGLPSGTFSTADEALSQGKEVLVVPGAITSPASRGSNRLLYQGAVPVVDDESFEDVLFSTFGTLKQHIARSGGGPGDDDPILAAVMAAPIDVESLYQLAERQFGGDARRRLNETLVDAESMGLIARQLDGKWGPVAHRLQGGASKPCP